MAKTGRSVLSRGLSPPSLTSIPSLLSYLLNTLFPLSATLLLFLLLLSFFSLVKAYGRRCLLFDSSNNVPIVYTYNIIFCSLLLYMHWLFSLNATCALQHLTQVYLPVDMINKNCYLEKKKKPKLFS